MAPKGYAVNLALVLVVMLWGGATAQSGCTSALIGLSSCLNYVSGNSSTPSSSCCPQLASVVQSQLRCLCSLLNGGGASLGVTINQNLALALAGACNVQTPPAKFEICNGKAAANGPTASAATPTTSPRGSPADETPLTAAANQPTTSASSPAKSPSISPAGSSDEKPAGGNVPITSATSPTKSPSSPADSSNETPFC